MNRTSRTRRPSARRTLVFLCVAAALGHASQAMAAEGVVMTGYNVQFGGPAGAVSETAISRSNLCGNDGAAAMLNLFNQVSDRLDERLDSGGLSASDRQSEAGQARGELCQLDEAFSVDAYAITYADCRMTMDTASMLVDISLPPGQDDGTMSMSDFYRAETSRLSLNRTLDDAGGAVELWASEIAWTGPGAGKEIAGHSASRWDFQYEAGFGGGSASPLAALGIDATMTTTGHGYYSTSAPGFDTVNAFFDRFASQVQAGADGGSMFSGMLNTMVDMLQKGMPLELEQSISSNMGGMGGMSMRSMMKATGLREVSLAEDYCTRELVPDYFTVTDMDAQMQAIGGAQSEELNQSMSDLNKAMEGMSPEQRDALKGLGLGGLLGGDTSANPAGQPAQAPAGGTATSSQSGPTSKELTTSNMTQSVQLHLEALGYDVGNTNGQLDTTTIISISQFQAEKDMTVTGEVSPQLLGILGAEVDSR